MVKQAQKSNDHGGGNLGSAAQTELNSMAQQIAAMVVAELSNQPLLVDRNRIAELTGLSVATIDRLRKEGVIPTIEVGSRKLFDPADVIAALNSPEP